MYFARAGLSATAGVFLHPERRARLGHPQQQRPRLGLIGYQHGGHVWASSAAAETDANGHGWGWASSAGTGWASSAVAVPGILGNTISGGRFFIHTNTAGTSGVISTATATAKDQQRERETLSATAGASGHPQQQRERMQTATAGAGHPQRAKIGYQQRAHYQHGGHVDGRARLGWGWGIIHGGQARRGWGWPLQCGGGLASMWRAAGCAAEMVSPKNQRFTILGWRSVFGSAVGVVFK